MSGNSLGLLLAEAAGLPGNNLFVLDENCQPEILAHLKAVSGCQLLTNRFDLWQKAAESGLPCLFNDFEFEAYPDHSLDNLFFRVSKERAVVNHIINQAFRVLRQGGVLHLGGGKQEGIKTHCANAGERFGGEAKTIKHGSFYHATITRLAQQSGPLNDNGYSRLRPIAELDGLPVSSKPGVFGWQKIDRGSALLASQFPGLFEGLENPSIMDLGCGYGYLSIMAWRSGASEVLATDNNAAAIASCRENFACWRIPGEVVADDCGVNTGRSFDLVVSHPPFHQGFEIPASLGERFVRSAAMHLKPGGRALFVVNSFVPLEQMAKSFFSSVSQWVNNRQFKVIAMQNPRRARQIPR